MSQHSSKIIIALVVVTAIASVAVWTRGGRADHDHPAEASHEAPDAPQHEARREVPLTPAQIDASGIKLAKAEAALIHTSTQYAGEVRFNADRTAHVVPRVAGVADIVSVDIGQVVRQGQVLAVLSSPELSDQRSALLAARERASAALATFKREQRLWQEKISAEQDYLQARQALREAEIEQRNAEQKLKALGTDVGTGAALSRFEVRAPLNGTVVEKHLALGEAVKDDANILLISDLSTVWVEISIPAKDIEQVRVGASTSVKASGSDTVASGKISYVGSLIGEQTRSAVARVTLPNPQGAWRPGLFVTVSLLSGQQPVPVSVVADAVQTIDEKPLIFVRTAQGFRATPVQLGRSDGQHTEILTGLSAGQVYATVNSFVLKAELGKGSAEHDH